MANVIPHNFIEALGKAQIDFSSHTFKAALMQNTFTPDAATHAEYSDVSGSELANGNGYATGGSTLTSVSFTNTTGTCTFDADNIQWTSATFTTRYVVLYDDTATNKDIICIYDMGSDKSPSDGTLTVAISTVLMTLSTV
jgi:hypothetical protein